MKLKVRHEAMVNQFQSSAIFLRILFFLHKYKKNQEHMKSYHII